ncbi:MAG: DUF481 domain-containing protein [Pseudomonadota bacterium]
MALLLAAVVIAEAEEGESGLPEPVKRMIDASRQTGDIVRVTWVALQAYPEFVDEVFAYSGVDPQLVQDEIVVVGKPETLEALAAASGMTPEEYASSVPITSPFWDPARWDGQFNLGASFASGNSDNRNGSFGVRAKRKYDGFANNFVAQFEINRSDGQTNQQRIQLGYQFDADLSPRTFAFGRTEFVDDQFSGFDYRVVLGGGVGRRVFQRDSLKWTVDGGPAWRRSALLNSSEVRDEFSFRGSSDLEWRLSEFATVTHIGSMLLTDITNTFESDLALVTDISSHLSTRLSFTLQYETNPPAGAVSTDTLTRASLLFDF